MGSPPWRPRAQRRLPDRGLSGASILLRETIDFARVLAGYGGARAGVKYI